MPKITFEKIIASDRDVIFKIATSYKEFEKILPQFFPSIRIRSIRGNTAIVEEHLLVGNRELIMMTKHVVEYPDVHKVFVIGGDAKGSSIIERYESVPQGCKVTIHADIKLRGIFKVLAIFTKRKISRDLEMILDEFAKAAQG